ncbi:MAG: peroxidase [Flavobacterium sp.]|uniref:Dyp-type peroxidase n=1 Tax=Flavobacterium sp. TaxID=239 RepID=UPI001205CC07|nr:Dyp-type peroxidase domain-containing protein [Flavobacterium sp.]RZJ65130.1 MAG: peroxidase [Flavobacterium sp.]
MKLLNQDGDNNKLFLNLQGNVLKGHGRDHTQNIFVTFKDIAEAKRWISEFAYGITSFKKQLDERTAFKEERKVGDVFYSFFISAKGYDYLGFTPDKFGDEAFKQGMKKRKDILFDQPSNWDKGFNNTCHAMILVADDDKIRLGKATISLIKRCNAVFTVDTIEYGNILRDAAGNGIEHFGYVDGVSQPIFMEDEVTDYLKHNVDFGNFDPRAEKELVLVEDPWVTSEKAFGSYFVFRKLEQNVQKFKSDEEELATSLLELTGEDEERAGAMLVGRFEDGTPVTISPAAEMINGASFNNFNYDQDIAGAKCPFHSHIRRSNPRTPDALKQRMARRGIPYGNRDVEPMLDPANSQMPDANVGLLFMSFQHSIVNQFEAIQIHINSLDGDGNGNDPVIGQTENSRENNTSGMFAKIYGDASPDSMTKCGFETSVKMRGGEYFFAPSIQFLKEIQTISFKPQEL